MMMSRSIGIAGIVRSLVCFVSACYRSISVMSNDIIHVHAESRRDETRKDELLYSNRIYSDDMAFHGMALMDRLHSSLYGIIAIAWYGTLT